MTRATVSRSVATLLIWCVLFQNAAAQVTAASNQTNRKPISYESLSLQIGQLLKTAADEEFLIASGVTDENARVLADKYQLARSEVSCTPPPGEEERPEQVAIRKMLCADIEYRLFLIQSRVGFWGGVRTLVPEIPPVHLRQLRTLLGEFEKLAGEMDLALNRNEVAENELLKDLAAQQKNSGQSRANMARRREAAISQEAAQLRKTQLDQRLGAIISQRAILLREEAGALALRESAQSALTTAIVKAAGASVGIPDWATDLAQGKSPEQTLRSAALSYIGDKLASDETFKGQLDGALNKVGTSTDQLVQAYNDATALKRRIEAYGADINRIGAVLRQPTLDGLVEVGTIAWNALPPEQKSSWRAKVTEEKPIFEAISLIARPESIGAQLTQRALDYLAAQPQLATFLRNSIQSYLDTRIDEAGALYGELLKRVAQINLSDDQARLTLDSVVRAASNWFVEKLDIDTRALLRRDLGVMTDLQLENRLAADGLSRLPRVRVVAGKVEVAGGAPDGPVFSIDVLTILKAPSTGEITIATEIAKKEILRFSSEVAAREQTIRQSVMALLPFEQLEAGLRHVISPQGRAVAGKAAEAWKKIIADDPATQAEATDIIAATHVGTAFVSQASSQANSTARDTLTNLQVPAATPRGAGPQGTGSQEEQALMLAMNAAFPGAGVGISLAKSIVEGLSALDSANKHLDLVRDQLKENFAAEARLLDLGQEAETNARLAEQEGQAFSALQEAYDQVAATNAFGINEILLSTERNQARIRIRRSLTFYLVERLREEFDLLDRSIGLWAGIEASPRGIIANLIQQDPQNIRLALDSEIDLFNFLDRSEEGTRTDVDRLLIHWRQLVRISEDACAQIGCEASTAAAQVRDSGLISLCDLLSKTDIEALRNWQHAPNSRLSLRFFLGPDQLAIPVGQRNHRMLAVRLGGVLAKPGESQGFCSYPQSNETKEQRLIAIRQVMLTHPGVGFVPRGDGLFTREGLLLRRAGSFQVPAAFDTEVLARRWIDTQIPQRGFLEGYSPFTEWQIDLDPDSSMVPLTDIVLRIAYQYNDPINIVTESEFVAAKSGSSVNPFMYEITWDQTGGVATAGQAPQATFRVSSHGTIRTPLETMAVLSSVRELVDSRGRTNRGPVLDLNLGKLATANFRFIRKCKNRTELIEDIAQGIEMAVGSRQNPREPWDLRRRALLAERYRQSARLEAEADRRLSQDDCRVPMVLVGSPLRKD